MPRAPTPLSVEQVATIGTGWHCDGLGLWLCVYPSKGARWVYRSGPGGCHVVTLGKARGVGALTLAEARDAVATIKAAQERARLQNTLKALLPAF